METTLRFDDRTVTVLYDVELDRYKGARVGILDVLEIENTWTGLHLTGAAAEKWWRRVPESVRDAVNSKLLGGYT